MMLAMQMGFAARNALQAYDMAELGITGPAQVLDGRFGFFHNFEHDSSIGEALLELAAPWKVTQLSHKPFPSGRVTHGTIHALRELQRELDLPAASVQDAVRSIVVRMPPLGTRLVGRPMIHRPPPNYARLCVPFVAATQLLHGNVDPGSFLPAGWTIPRSSSWRARCRWWRSRIPIPTRSFPRNWTWCWPTAGQSIATSRSPGGIRGCRSRPGSGRTSSACAGE